MNTTIPEFVEDRIIAYVKERRGSECDAATAFGVGEKSVKRIIELYLKKTGKSSIHPARRIS